MGNFSRSSFLNLIGLQTPQSRLLVFSVISAAIYLISYSSLISLPTISVFSRLGIDSPSVGLTRAYWLVLHGSFEEAWQMNRLIYLVIAALLVIVVLDIIKLLKPHLKKGQ